DFHVTGVQTCALPISGYWFLEAPEWEPDAALAAFLKAGEAPIYVGFGSMPGQDARSLTSMVVDGLRQAGKRGLIASGGGALDARSEERRGGKEGGRRR